jgi:hypothetical protein
MPMITKQITQVDEQRAAFIDKLTQYVESLREELRANELVLASVIGSLSEQNENSRRLGQELERRRSEQRPSPAIRPIETPQRTG